MQQLFEKIRRTSDWQALALLTAVFMVATWILVLPFSGSFQAAAMKRFHLATPSYWQWAIQQPIPSMYNFENRYWISKSPLKDEQLELGIKSAHEHGLDTRFANHYPARIFTFADARNHYLGPGNQDKDPHRYLHLQSRYRGTTVSTLMEAIPDDRGGFWLHRREGFVE